MRFLQYVCQKSLLRQYDDTKIIKTFERMLNYLEQT